MLAELLIKLSLSEVINLRICMKLDFILHYTRDLLVERLPKCLGCKMWDPSTSSLLMWLSWFPFKSFVDCCIPNVKLDFHFESTAYGFQQTSCNREQVWAKFEVCYCRIIFLQAPLPKGCEQTSKITTEVHLYIVNLSFPFDCILFSEKNTFSLLSPWESFQIQSSGSYQIFYLFVFFSTFEADVRYDERCKKVPDSPQDDLRLVFSAGRAKSLSVCILWRVGVWMMLLHS